MAGRSIPEKTAYDSEGKLTTDPTRAMEGAILPFDRSYKGAGLAMIVEILAGVLTGSGFVGIGEEKGWGNLIFIIDPKLLGNKKEFQKKVNQLVENVKKSKKLPGIKEILVPGERGDRLSRENLKSGKIEIEDNLYQELKKVASRII
jgi:LDH2 family malate/lactate/ureidoglycolate dehydrogenase